MADRTSAEIFSEIFCMLASDEPIDRQALAKWFWEKSRGYDFNDYQMYCDEALIKLGLARMQADPEDLGRNRIIYYGSDEWWG